jgi:HD-like signal output (HDOD) protein
MDAFTASLRAHCSRVAGWACELAAGAGLSAHESKILELTALNHHRDRMDDAESQSVLNAFRVHGNGVGRIAMIADLLEMAELFDEQLELAQLEGISLLEVLQSSRDGEPEPVVGPMLLHLRKATREDVIALVQRLPVYPAAAIAALSVLAKENLSLCALDQVARGDQVMAGLLLASANSARYNLREPIRTITHAVNFIGLDLARKILAAAAIRPLFCSANLKPLWSHSLESAELAERIAILSGKADPREAFLAGLMHDIGRLAFGLMPANVSAICQRLIQRGCEPLLAELVVLSMDHAEAGEIILKIWKFHPSILSAIRYHHQPDRGGSDLAAVLYLTEFWSASEEDLPSNRLLDYSLHRLGLSLEKLEAAKLDHAVRSGGALVTVMA